MVEIAVLTLLQAAALAIGAPLTVAQEKREVPIVAVPTTPQFTVLRLKPDNCVCRSNVWPEVRDDAAPKSYSKSAPLADVNPITRSPLYVAACAETTAANAPVANK